jgi:hypothetical protein
MDGEKAAGTAKYLNGVLTARIPLLGMAVFPIM